MSVRWAAKTSSLHKVLVNVLGYCVSAKVIATHVTNVTCAQVTNVTCDTCFLGHFTLDIDADGHLTL